MLLLLAKRISLQLPHGNSGNCGITETTFKEWLETKINSSAASSNITLQEN